jgi:hypothetical protein
MRKVNIELKRTRLTSHTDNELMDMSDRYRLRVLLPKRQQIFPRWTSTFSKRQLTVGRKWRHGSHERLDIVLSEFCLDGRYRWGTTGVYIWAKLTLLLIDVIIVFNYICVHIYIYHEFTIKRRTTNYIQTIYYIAKSVVYVINSIYTSILTSYYVEIFLYLV